MSQAMAAVEVDAEGRLRVRTGKVELGQGLHTALAQIVAEALGVALAQVQMLAVDTDWSPDQGVTSGSLSVQEAGQALRQACAALDAASLARLKRDPALPAARLGESVARPELPGLFAGQAHFIHDLLPPGTVHGRVLHPPLIGATVAAWDEAAARASPGLLQLHRDGNLFGLVASGSALADAALARLAASLRWSLPDCLADEADDLPQLPSTTTHISGGAAPAQGGHSDNALTDGRQVTARYTKPWIAHASLAPSCALACWSADLSSLRVWSHSQGIFNLRRDLGLAFDLAPQALRVSHVRGAGCYGHNGADDAAFDAAWAARTVPGQTVRLVWRRSDELSHGPFGPTMRIELQARLGGDGRIHGWQHDLWSAGHSRRPGRSPSPALLGAWQLASRAHAVPASIDVGLAQGGGAARNALPGYDFAQWQVHAHSVVGTRRSSALRSLGAFANTFAAESFIDEIAHAGGLNPLALRRAHLQHDPRALAVLDAAAARAGYHGGRASAAAEGVGQGIAVARYKGSGAWCAVVAEVHAGERLRVRRLTIAVDVGLAVNPDGVVNQIEGGAIQATSWTLLEAAARSHEGWADYPILRFSEVPAVEVLLMPSNEPSLGAGEASMGPTAAAIANALFDALGIRVRDLPLTPQRIVAAMA